LARTNAVWRGAIEGLLAGVAYWSIESFLLHVVPWLTEPSAIYMPPDAAFTAILLLMYATVGAAMGAVLGCAFRIVLPGSAADPDTSALRIRAAAALGWSVLAIGSALPRLPRGLPGWYFLLCFSPVGLILFASLLSGIWANRCRLFANPWVAITVLVGLPTVFNRSHARPGLLAGVLWLLPLLGAAIALSALMSRRLPRSILSVASVALLVLAASFLLRQTARRETPLSASASPANQPNIILITLDTVRADHLSLYGYERETTPNLRRLAAQSTVYTQAISAGDMTLSSHASIFTGMNPSWHKAHFDPAYEGGRPLDTRYPTIAEILSAKGYDTGGVAANYLFLGYGFGLDRGFAFHDSRGPKVLLGRTEPFLLRDRIRNSLIGLQKPWQYDQAFRRADQINDTALAFFDREKARGRKFFGFLNYMDAHWPYLPPGRFATMFPGTDPNLRTGHYDAMEREILTLRRPISERERRHLISQYDGGIAYMDAALGTLMEQLKQRGLFENTLLIITADHGEAFGERAIIGHALSVYQDEVHVPLLIKYPGQSAPVRNDAFVSLTDLAPTILSVLGYAPPRNMQGSDLSRSSPAGAGDVVSETFTHPLMSKWSPRFLRSEQAIFAGPLKFIRSSNGDRELYDLARDPHEQHNLAGSRPTDSFDSKLVQYLKAAAVDNRRKAPAPAGNGNLKQLKSLGYIEGK
jgi:arylsulfatase A-like enzyme